MDELDELPEVYNMQSIEQMRALADELRLRIVELLVQQPLTVTQLGEALGVAPARVHYHVRELERLALVRLVFTREKSGILEKYYRAVAKNISVPPSLLQSAPADEVLSAANEYVQVTLAGFMRTAAYAIRHPSDLPGILGLTGASLWMTPEEADGLYKEIQGVFGKYERRRGIEGERLFSYLSLWYDVRIAGEPPELASPAAERPTSRPPGAPVPPSAQPPSVESPTPPVPPSAHPPTLRAPFSSNRVWGAGVVVFTKRDLEAVLARGGQLDINVLGFCRFADDITPELADRAIARFRCTGIVSDSPEVGEVLKRKEQ